MENGAFLGTTASLNLSLLGRCAGHVCTEVPVLLDTRSGLPMSNPPSHQIFRHHSVQVNDRGGGRQGARADPGQSLPAQFLYLPSGHPQEAEVRLNIEHMKCRLTPRKKRGGSCPRT